MTDDEFSKLASEKSSNWIGNKGQKIAFEAGMHAARTEMLADDDYAYSAKQMNEVMNKCLKLNEELEIERMRLTACGVAAMSNTVESIEKHRLSRDNEYWSASYADVCDAVDREIDLRKQLNNALRKDKK